MLLLVVVGVTVTLQAQRWRATDDIPRYESYLKEALPTADTFRFVDRNTPHYRGYRTAADGAEELVGLGFFTVDFARGVVGYKGEIWMLVGMAPTGYFSIDLPEFLAQFQDQSVLAPLTVGEDIDAISRATITNKAAVRSIRESSRKMAREFLSERGTEP